ncbi:MAG: leucine-rich repeat domain-containing protein [Bacteroidaceae bacterium]|nr:leucine-rich repeat domain-containing protein [Bacteroidaceae bacterium]
MRKHLLLALVGLFSICLVTKAEVLSGECGASGNNLTWTLDTETGKLVISGEGAIEQSSWRQFQNYIRTVDIQEGVTSIPSSAFDGYSNLSNVIIAESVTSIGYYAFYGCKSLINITIPNNVSYIGSSAFANCTNLQSVIIPSTTLESYAFQGCENIKKVTIRNRVKEIKKGAFDRCTSIEKVIVEDGAETLTLGAAGGYSKGLFRDSPIKNLYIGRNLEYNTTSDYGYSPFYALRTLTSLSIGSQVSLLKDNAFSNCSQLNSITCLNSNPPTCGTNTFSSAITSSCKLSVPTSSINTYKSTSPWSDFKNITGNKNVSGTCGTNLTWELTPMGELKIKGKGDMSDYKYYNTPWFDYRTSIVKISISEGVTSIGDLAFYNCSFVDTIDLSKDITHIGNYAFENCAVISTISLPEKLSYIGNGAFLDCISLYSFTIPNSVTYIGASSFENTAWYNAQSDGILYIGSALYTYKGDAPWDTSINITEGTKYICPYALNGRQGITSVVIPNSMISIGEYALYGCRNITSISCNAETPPTCGNYSFENINKSIPVYVPVSSVSTYKNADLWKDFENIQRNDIVASGSETYNHPNDTSILIWKLTLEGELIVEGTGTFKGSPGGEHKASIKKITVCNGISALGNWAFSDYENVISISLPSSITKMGTGAFYDCYNLQFVTLENGLTEIADQAFFGCSGLTSITIPNGVTSIGKWAFSDCCSLISIAIPNSVTNIENNAFAYANSIADVFCYAENVPRTNSYAFNGSSISSATLHVPYGCKAVYEAASPWNQFGNIVEMPSVIEIGETGFATYCSTNALDFSEVMDIKAYIVSGFNQETGTLVLTRVTEVPAGEGLYIAGTPGRHEIPQTETTMFYSNLLKGVTEPTIISPTDGNYTNYILSNGSYGVGFYTLSQTGTLDAGKAYLQLPTASVAGIKALKIEFDENDDPTGIAITSTSPTEENTIYNLAGQRVSKAQKGINIVNGKKVFIK